MQYLSQYQKNGYCKIEKVFDEEFINELIKEINNLKDADIYLDNNKKLRRIERLYNKGTFLNKLNNKISDILKNILNREFLIFKDKFNAKPPGGEGFFAHFDGIFHFIDDKNKKRNGWYEYGNLFVNVLVALDNCTEENGTIEIAKSYKNDFETLVDYTKKNGTPEIVEFEREKIKFNKIILNKGDIVLFSNTCPHQSKKNQSSSERRTLYYTYLCKSFGSQYENYFSDKKNSKNMTSKSLSAN